MSTPPTNKEGQSSPAFWYQLSTDSSQPPSVPPAISAPSLALWSRKLALQSEELAGLIQSSSTKLSSHQEQLQDLLKSCKVDVADAKKEIDATGKRRDNESTCSVSTLISYTRTYIPPAVDSHLIIIRRLSQTISDVISALEAKLSVLDTLHTLHKKLQSHDLLFRELAAGQEHLLHTQQKLSTAQETIAAKQESQMKDILRVLDQIEVRQSKAQDQACARGVAVAPGEDIAVKDSQPPLKSKRQRRLLSDEEIAREFSPGVGYRPLSMELLPFVETREITPVDRAADAGGATGLERPLKRKLLNTMDIAQFNDDDL